MLYDLREINNESDMHGEPCPVCADQPCVTNLYVTTHDGWPDGTDTRHTCESATCMAHTLAAHHHGDEMPIVELSIAPMPWVLGGPIGAGNSGPDLVSVTGSVRPAGRVA